MRLGSFQALATTHTSHRSQDMVRLLLDARFRTRDEGRCFVLLSLAEAETLRRVLHARLQEKEPILRRGWKGDGGDGFSPTSRGKM